MRLSKTGYYADFVIYAAVLATATVVTAWRRYRLRNVVLAVRGGHRRRFLDADRIHHPPLRTASDSPFAAMHGAHHDAPLAFVGTPTWLSLGVILGAVFLPAWAFGSLQYRQRLGCGHDGGIFLVWRGAPCHSLS